MLVVGVLDVAADRLARTAFRDTDRDAAVDAAERAVTLRPDDIRYRLVAAEAYLDRGSLADIDRADRRGSTRHSTGRRTIRSPPTSWRPRCRGGPTATGDSHDVARGTGAVAATRRPRPASCQLAVAVRTCRSTGRRHATGSTGVDHRRRSRRAGRCRAARGIGGSRRECRNQMSGGERVPDVDFTIARPSRSPTRALLSSSPVHSTDAADPIMPFEEFYREQRAPIGRALALTLRDPQLASEAVDEAMARAYQRWSRVQSLDNPGGWVYRVGLNWSRSILRRALRPAPRVAHIGSDTVTDRSGLDPAIDRALAQLSDRAARRRGVPLVDRLLGSADGGRTRPAARHREEPPGTSHDPPAITPLPSRSREQGRSLMNDFNPFEQESGRSPAPTGAGASTSPTRPSPTWSAAAVNARERRRRRRRPRRSRRPVWHGRSAPFSCCRSRCRIASHRPPTPCRATRRTPNVTIAGESPPTISSPR